jgi:hypothetical protein
VLSAKVLSAEWDVNRLPPGRPGGGIVLSAKVLSAEWDRESAAPWTTWRAWRRIAIGRGRSRRGS